MFSGRKFSSDIFFLPDKPGEHPHNREVPEEADKGLYRLLLSSYPVDLSRELRVRVKDSLGQIIPAPPLPRAAKWHLSDAGLPGPYQL